MFDLDAGKLVVIGVVALIVIGPKDLPRVLRQVGQSVAKLRRMASDFQSQFMEAMREAELDDIRKDMAALNDTAKMRSFDPLGAVRRELSDAMTDRPAAATTTVAALPTAVDHSEHVTPAEPPPSAHDPIAEPLLPFPSIDAGLDLGPPSPPPIPTPNSSRDSSPSPSEMDAETHLAGAASRPIGGA
jgi:sec-independent protein translocase protein TatB